MIKAVIVDDEDDARFMLRNLLERHFKDSIEIVAEADDVPAAVETIKKHKPELVFLDIKMHQGTGFDVLEKIGEVDFEVVFITAYDQYAIKAFQFSALGYLMKPIKISELQQVMSNLENKLKKLQESSDKRLKVLVENYGDDRKIKKLVISNMTGFSVVPIENIVRLDGDKNYTHFIVLNQKKITASKTLGEYEELLAEHGFFRAHQSTLVNLRHVKGYNKADNQIELNDGSKVQLSRHRKPEFVKRFM